MGVTLPTKTITRRICEAIRAGQSLDRAAKAVGVDARTFTIWCKLGHDAANESCHADPHARFARAVAKAIRDAERVRTSSPIYHAEPPRQPEPDAPPRRPAEPPRTTCNRSSECPPLAALVVRPAPIEFVDRSRPVWVFGGEPNERPETPVERPDEVDPTTLPTHPPFAVETDDEHETLVEAECPPSRIMPTSAIIAISAVMLAALIAAISLIVAITPIVLAARATLWLTRSSIAIAYRWRAGVLALRGGGADGCRWPVPWATRRMSMSCIDVWALRPNRTHGAIALAGRTRPQRE